MDCAGECARRITSLQGKEPSAHHDQPAWKRLPGIWRALSASRDPGSRGQARPGYAQERMLAGPGACRLRRPVGSRLSWTGPPAWIQQIRSSQDGRSKRFPRGVRVLPDRLAHARSALCRMPAWQGPNGGVRRCPLGARPAESPRCGRVREAPGQAGALLQGMDRAWEKSLPLLARTAKRSDGGGRSLHPGVQHRAAPRSHRQAGERSRVRGNVPGCREPVPGSAEECRHPLLRRAEAGPVAPTNASGAAAGHGPCPHPGSRPLPARHRRALRSDEPPERRSCPASGTQAPAFGSARASPGRSTPRLQTERQSKPLPTAMPRTGTRRPGQGWRSIREPRRTSLRYRAPGPAWPSIFLPGRPVPSGIRTSQELPASRERSCDAGQSRTPVSGPPQWIAKGEDVLARFEPSRARFAECRIASVCRIRFTHMTPASRPPRTLLRTLSRRGRPVPAPGNGWAAIRPFPCSGSDRRGGEKRIAMHGAPLQPSRPIALI